MKIYSCEEWGARSPNHSFETTDPTCSVVHHMDWPNRPLIADHGEAVKKAFEVAQRCQDDHMDSNGWADTGQNFTVTREGIILEGRHGSLQALLNGQSVHAAHAADPDTGADANNSPGTEHEGTYINDVIPKPQWAASVWLQAFICFKMKLDTSTVKGHRDTGCSTDCPGDWFHDHLPEFRAQVHLMKVQMMKGNHLQWQS